MARDPKDEAIARHRQWLGYLQPVGVVVSAPALAEAGVYLDDDVLPAHQRFLELVKEMPVGRTEPEPAIPNFAAFATTILGWRDTDLIGAADPRLTGLEVFLEAYRETLRPTYAVPQDGAGSDGSPSWLLLIQVLEPGVDFDAHSSPTHAQHWDASPQVRFERLLRGGGVPIGVLFNATELRLVYAPAGETTGHINFPFKFLAEVGGRAAFAALLMLLGEQRLFKAADKQLLPAVLAQSRRFQNTVSTELAEQVLAALFELLRGFQAADAQAQGELLKDVLVHDPDSVYAGLVTVLMRLVFLLYAEDRGLMSSTEVYGRHYSVSGLYERLREEAGRNPDTMDLRYGAWPQLLALFRLVYNGGRHGKFAIPARHGYLFDYARKYPFLEGRPHGHEADPQARINPPLVSDGVIFRVLNNLMVLNGERISYLTLDVEQIGSVYEAIMGYRLEVAAGPSIALKPKKAHGAPLTIDLEKLLAQKPTERGKWLKEQTEQAADGKALTALKDAKTPSEAVAALERKVAKALTPHIVPPGGMILQPSDERRRSGSHYTPRSLTGPIVKKALEPVLQQLGGNPAPEQILALKVCDPAVGSGAFLVEACRQLGEALLKAWVSHQKLPRVPDDETPELLAQRTIAQRCLYGVDKNPMAVDLAKLSLWLGTLAKYHPFTFLDHALRCGDSLVGLTSKQIRTFHWKPGEKEQMVSGQEYLRQRLEAATRYRAEIISSGDETPQLLKEEKLRAADDALDLVRFAGNLTVAAFFKEDKDRKREETRNLWRGLLTAYLQSGFEKPTREEATLRSGNHPVQPFHWEIEFPEVFGREQEGFDVIVGNPPFAGKNTITSGNRDGYLDWLKVIHPEAHGNADLVAHFFRRAFNLLRPGGAFGLIATNTIAQGDTRSTGLRWICTNGGTIYAARRRYKWPGQAAVVVSVVHVRKGAMTQPFELDGRSVERITAYLFHAGGNEDPSRLSENDGKSFTGVKIYGGGFTFDDTDNSGIANPLSLMNELVLRDERNSELLFPYIGGEEVNDSPTQSHHRYVINFGSRTEEEAREWPDLLTIVEEKVKPYRNEGLRTPWWQFERPRTEMFDSIRSWRSVLANSSVSSHLAMTMLSTSVIPAHTVNLFLHHSHASFSVLQSRVHEIWARFFASSMKDDLRYTPSDCFETFPFSRGFESDPSLEEVGKAYYEFRADLMVRNNEGLTRTYNRFHNPHEQSAEIVTLRELHAAMDRAVLKAYGGDLAKLNVPPCQHLLDYEDEDEDSDDGQPETGRQRKKPWRYRWPDAFRDEVLALLLELNKQRAEEERMGLLTAAPEKPKPKRAGRKRAPGEESDGKPKLPGT